MYGFYDVRTTATLAWSSKRGFFYLYMVLKTITGMLSEGTVHCLALAYLVTISITL